MDTLDRKIMTQLTEDARVSVSVLARRLDVARTTIQARIERLETSGIIGGYTLRPGPALVKHRLRATVLITIEPRAQPTILTRLRAIDAIIAVHTTSGRFDLLAEAVADTPAALDEVLDEIGQMPGIRGSESLIHLSTKIDRGL
ncbi:AsnC family transcriptional regulator [Actibacterium mucosum KCTC 23349]|uniref:AsnC family transcriptional regulator n=1 Tax=Actibacterium mucosum KCTC 23349 TaxID=1454373 RepID=A0A037ZLX1_9RHOB|nr:Lrp/AsnC family transcriptional regulator [Actibacterium mucosum]KAJ56542.1 AsnC family transcriptional regulator [Actibacterium mucosum KCTC 23349]